MPFHHYWKVKFTPWWSNKAQILQRLTSPVAVGSHFLEDWFVPCQELLLVGDIEEVHLQVRHNRRVLPLFVHVTAIADDKFLKKNNKSSMEFDD